MSNGSRAPVERRVHSTRFSGGSRYACRLHTRSAGSNPALLQSAFLVGGVQSTRFLGFSAFPDSASLLIGNNASDKNVPFYSAIAAYLPMSGIKHFKKVFPRSIHQKKRSPRSVRAGDSSGVCMADRPATGVNYRKG